MVVQYLCVPCTTQRLPLPTKTAAAVFVLLFSSCKSCGDIEANASTFSNATPSAMKPNPLRAHAKKVRSLASRSRATDPVFFRGSVRKDEARLRNICRVNHRALEWQVSPGRSNQCKTSRDAEQ